MTRKEAIKEIRNVFIENFADEIIKALEQESCGKDINDKYKAESEESK